MGSSASFKGVMRKGWKCFHFRVLKISLCVTLLTIFCIQSSRADTLFKAENNCLRSYVYRNRTFPVDSSRKMDGEGLRQVLRNSPQSEIMLNEYQGNLKSSKVPAYLGTVGLLVLVGGPIYASSLDSEIGASDTRTLSILTGAGILVSSYLFGKFSIKQNEAHLESAVEKYNQSVDKNEQINVSLSPTPMGDGGQIKTIVPFQF